tara:strand:+ start:110 stop:607 length:498 start_codon:yes stop_codon:yes gene_type:complete
MSVTNGRDLRIQIGGLHATQDNADGYAIPDAAGPSAILLATSCSLSVSGDMLESATKDDSGKWKSKVLSGLTATLTHSGLLSTSTSAISDHWAKLIAGEEFYWSFTTGSARSLAGADAEGSGAVIFSGRGIFTGLSVDAGDLQNSTLELPIEVTGPVQCIELTVA